MQEAAGNAGGGHVSKCHRAQQTDLILLDFSKAFDKVRHEKLLLKLHQYGIRVNVLHWIKAFLSNRFQAVVMENEKPSQVAVIRSATGFGAGTYTILSIYQ